MEWRDTGVLLSVRKHGETAVIIEVFTESHGRHAGVVQGGVSRRLAPILQPGAQISVAWRARLEDHIGTFTVEPIRSRAVQLMQDRLVLAAFGTISALLSHCLPEREDHRALYENTVRLIESLGAHPDWLVDYTLWEAELLRELGYGLDLNECAVTGATQDLIYVSPKSGRAVSRAGAGDWADKLLPLPLVLRVGGSASRHDICQALYTTGYFLERQVMVGLGRAAMPAARDRFIAMLSRGLE